MSSSAPGLPRDEISKPALPSDEQACPSCKYSCNEEHRSCGSCGRVLPQALASDVGDAMTRSRSSQGVEEFSDIGDMTPKKATPPDSWRRSSQEVPQTRFSEDAQGTPSAPSNDPCSKNSRPNSAASMAECRPGSVNDFAFPRPQRRESLLALPQKAKERRMSAPVAYRRRTSRSKTLPSHAFCKKLETPTESDCENEEAQHSTAGKCVSPQLGKGEDPLKKEAARAAELALQMKVHASSRAARSAGCTATREGGRSPSAELFMTCNSSDCSDLDLESVSSVDPAMGLSTPNFGCTPDFPSSSAAGFAPASSPASPSAPPPPQQAALRGVTSKSASTASNLTHCSTEDALLRSSQSPGVGCVVAGIIAAPCLSATPVSDFSSRNSSPANDVSPDHSAGARQTRQNPQMVRPQAEIQHEYKHLDLAIKPSTANGAPVRHPAPPLSARGPGRPGTGGQRFAEGLMRGSMTTTRSSTSAEANPASSKTALSQSAANALAARLDQRLRRLGR